MIPVLIVMIHVLPVMEEQINVPVVYSGTSIMVIINAFFSVNFPAKHVQYLHNV